MNKKAKKRYEDKIKNAFINNESGKELLFERNINTMYPSDQVGFPYSVGVAALKKNKLLGVYMNKIHTKRDTEWDERNIIYLVEGSTALVRNLTQA